MIEMARAAARGAAPSALTAPVAALAGVAVV